MSGQRVGWGFIPAAGLRLPGEPVPCGVAQRALQLLQRKEISSAPHSPSVRPPAFSFTEDQPCMAALVFVQPAGRAGVLLHSRCGHARGVTILLSQFTEDALGYIWHQSFFFF